MTEEYYVQDGIDQGEVWFPILWRIFYDALLTRLEQIKDKVRYKIEENKIINIDKREEEKLELNFNVTAFMDDTTLISKNKEGLEKMIKIRHEFFKINDIKANIGKYKLIKINNNQDNLVIEGEEVKKVNSCEGNRYLGFFLNMIIEEKYIRKRLNWS